MPLTVPVVCTCCTPLIRPIMAGAVVGSSAVPPVTFCPLLTVSRLVPSWLISLSRPAWDEADRPRTATMAATPMAMPRADSPARSFRVRSPTVESRVRSESGNRLRLRMAAAGTAAPDGRVRRTQPAVREWGAEPGRREGAARVPVPAAGPVSATIRPSRIPTVRGMRSAMAWSWVMTTMVEPAWWSWSIRARMDCPVAWSRLPVGSSASTMAGWPTKARAMATRWRCPPESWVGRT